MSTHSDAQTRAKPTVPTDRSVKPVLNKSRTCQCSICELYFTGPSVFDRHFKNAGYQCYTATEMRAIGMTTNEHGVWMWGLSEEAMKAGGKP